MVLHDLVDDVGLGEGADVAELPVLVGRHLAEDAAHDLARAGLGQRAAKLEETKNSTIHIILYIHSRFIL